MWFVKLLVKYDNQTKTKVTIAFQMYNSLMKYQTEMIINKSIIERHLQYMKSRLQTALYNIVSDNLKEKSWLGDNNNIMHKATNLPGRKRLPKLDYLLRRTKAKVLLNCRLVTVYGTEQYKPCCWLSLILPLGVRRWERKTQTSEIWHWPKAVFRFMEYSLPWHISCILMHQKQQPVQNISIHMHTKTCFALQEIQKLKQINVPYTFGVLKKYLVYSLCILNRSILQVLWVIRVHVNGKPW